jgi:hypothetical protein
MTYVTMFSNSLTFFPWELLFNHKVMNIYSQQAIPITYRKQHKHKVFGKSERMFSCLKINPWRIKSWRRGSLKAIHAIKSCLGPHNVTKLTLNVLNIYNSWEMHNKLWYVTFDKNTLIVVVCDMRILLTNV